MTFDIATFSVRRWQFTLVAFALLTMLGVSAFLTTPRSEDPHFPIPTMIVRAVLPGAEPAELEQLVADPIEDALSGLDDVDTIASTSTDGAVIISVDFTWDVDVDRKYDEVVREVSALRGALPQGLTQLQVQRARTTEVAVIQVALVSGAASRRSPTGYGNGWTGCRVSARRSTGGRRRRSPASRWIWRDWPN
jgi:multidrug efflux pump subunit AcrB